jgi:nucleoside-diphosphate-sugar epimerase
MPALSGHPSLILVTGANGFVGMWIVRHLLEKDYSVRAAVRTKERGQHLLEIFKSHGNKLQLTIVGNMTEVRRSSSTYEKDQ